MKRIKEIKTFKNKIFYDKRGYLFESFNQKKIKKNFPFHIVSNSKKNVLRGLHLQFKNPQGKFVTVIKGKIFDVMVDLRKKSKTFGKYFSIYLNSKNTNSAFVPPGFAHGFCCLEKENIIYYLNTNYRDKKNEIGIAWNDKDIKIKWPIKEPILSNKDKNNLSLREYCKLIKN